MKYLLVGLLFLAALPGHTQPPPAAVNLAASASARVRLAAGAVVDARIEVRQTPTERRVGLTLVVTARVCTAGLCQDQRTLFGVTYADVVIGDAVLDRDLRLGAVHTTLRFQDTLSGAEVPVRLDVVWAAQGPVRCEDQTANDGCTRAATATAIMAVGGQLLMAGQTVADAQLVQHRRWV